MKASMSGTYQNRRAGFTLVEILIAVVVTVIIRKIAR